MWPWNRRALRAATTLAVTAAASAALLSACVAGPDFRRPAAPSADTYTRASLTDLQAAGTQLQLGQAPPREWWSLYASQRLNDTIRVALAGNRDLAAAQATLAQASAVAAAATGARYPQVDLDASAGRQQLGAASLGDVHFPPFTFYSIGPAVSFSLDYTGGVRRAIEAQGAQVDYQKYELDAAYLSLTGNVALQALNIASTRAQINSVETLLTEDTDNLRLVQTAFDAGSVARVDVLSAQSQLANDQTLLPPLLQQLSVAKHALSILAGRLPADWAPPDFELDELAPPQALPLTLPSDVARSRPDILAAEAQLHAANADVGVASSDLYPHINLSASADLQSTALNHLFDSSSTAGVLTGALTAPLFDHGALRARQRAALAALRAAHAHYEQTVLASFGQIADALEALEHDAQLLAAEQRAVDAAAANLDLTRRSYSAGNVGILQMLDAERSHQQAQLGLIRARAQRYQHAMQLVLASGGAA
jgi:NodT family efflux transporter outer membrane factor (OMF) lipoprotein